jgi:hypothetical protein
LSLKLEEHARPLQLVDFGVLKGGPGGRLSWGGGGKSRARSGVLEWGVLCAPTTTTMKGNWAFLEMSLVFYFLTFALIGIYVESFNKIRPNESKKKIKKPVFYFLTFTLIRIIDY